MPADAFRVHAKMGSVTLYSSTPDGRPVAPLPPDVFADLTVRARVIDQMLLSPERGAHQYGLGVMMQCATYQT
jgi:hypothetical protein